VQVGETALALKQLLTIPEHKAVAWFCAVRAPSVEDCFSESRSIVHLLASQDDEPLAKKSKGVSATSGRTWREMLPMRCARMLWRRRRPVTSKVKPADDAASPTLAALPDLCCNSC